VYGNVVPLGDPVAMGNGVMDDQVRTNRIAAFFPTLNVNDLNIADLTGIEDFDSITALNCYNNDLISLNTSGAVLLEDIDASGNSLLTSIDVSGNSALKELQLNGSNLNTLDVSANTLLEDLRCSDNNLSTLDISANTALKLLHCDNNNFTQLNTSANSQLTEISCSGNQITDLDMSANTQLIYVDVRQNALENFNIQNGNNTNIPTNSFYAFDNPDLTCIFVDDATWSTANWTNIDSNSTFVETQAQCDHQQFSVKELSNGIYFLQIVTENNKYIKRIIKR